MAEAARKSLQELGAIFLGVSISKIVVSLASVHHPLAELLMETAIHVFTLTLLHVATTLSSAESLCLVAEAFLRRHSNPRRNQQKVDRCITPRSAAKAPRN